MYTLGLNKGWVVYLITNTGWDTSDRLVNNLPCQLASPSLRSQRIQGFNRWNFKTKIVCTKKHTILCPGWISDRDVICVTDSASFGFAEPLCNSNLVADCPGNDTVGVSGSCIWVLLVLVLRLHPSTEYFIWVLLVLVLWFHPSAGAFIWVLLVLGGTCGTVPPSHWCWWLGKCPPGFTWAADRAP